MTTDTLKKITSKHRHGLSLVEHSKRLNTAMDNLMDKKRAVAPHLYTKEFNEKLANLNIRLRKKASRCRFHHRRKNPVIKQRWQPYGANSIHLSCSRRRLLKSFAGVADNILRHGPHYTKFSFRKSIVEVILMGSETFGNMDVFKLWLETPTDALGNVKPIELFKDSDGMGLVLGELNRINYGILS